MRQLVALSSVMVLTFVGARPAHADSDGYYCIGPNYLAYQLSLGPKSAGHFLYVVSLPDSAPVGPPTKVHLPRFQVHGMSCGASSVQLLGWDSLYTVNLTGPRPSVVTQVAPWTKRGTSRHPPPDYAQLNLGGWSPAGRAGRPDTIALGVQSTASRFLLAFDVRSTEQPCAYKLVTRLLQLDAASHLVATLKLFDGEALRECGE